MARFILVVFTLLSGCTLYQSNTAKCKASPSMAFSTLPTASPSNNDLRQSLNAILINLDCEN